MRSAATSAGQRALDETLRNHQLDAIVSPTNNAAWKTRLGVGDANLFLASYGPAAVAGYPDVTVPMGFDGALPLGMSFLAGRFSEPELLALAYSFEQGTQARRLPELLPTIG
jgi:amidase